MAVITRSSTGGKGAQYKPTKSGSAGVSSKIPKKTRMASNLPNEPVGSGLRSGKRNIPSPDSDGEEADDELHPTEDCPPPLKRRRKGGQLPAGQGRSKSKANKIPSKSISQEGSGYDSPTAEGAPVPGNSRTNPQRNPPRRISKRDNVASSKSGSNTGTKAARPRDPSRPTAATNPEQVEELSSSLSELTTTEGSPLPLPAAPLPPAEPTEDEQVSSVPRKEDDDIVVPTSEPESVVPASQAGSAPLASQDSSIVPASVSGSSQLMDVSCTQDEGGGDGEKMALASEATQTTTSGQQNGLTQEALESFSMEESLPRSAMDTQTSKDAVEEHDRLSYVTDEDENPQVPPTQENPPIFAPPLFNDNAGDWRPPGLDDVFVPPAPVMKDLDVFSQSQPYSSQGGTQRDVPSSSQMSFVSSAGQVSPNQPSSFRYPLLVTTSSNDAAQRPFSRFDSPFAQSLATSRAVPNTKRNFALGFDAIHFDDPGQAPSLAFPPPFPPPQSSDPPPIEHHPDGEQEIALPDDQPYQQL